MLNTNYKTLESTESKTPSPLPSSAGRNFVSCNFTSTYFISSFFNAQFDNTEFSRECFSVYLNILDRSKGPISCNKVTNCYVLRNKRIQLKISAIHFLSHNLWHFRFTSQVHGILTFSSLNKANGVIVIFLDRRDSTEIVKSLNAE